MLGQEWKMEPEFPGVTVVVLTYFSSSSVILTLASIVKQENVRLQIVVSDDGSTDDSCQVATDFMNDHSEVEWALVQNPSNLGTVRNLMGAMAHARFPFVKTLGAGDMLADGQVLSRLHAKATGCDADLIVSQPLCFHWDEARNLVRNDFSFPGDYYISKYFNKNDFLFPIINLDAFFSGSTFFLKKDLFSTFEKYFKNVRYAEDLLQVVAAIANQRIFFEDTYCVLYECGNGVSTNGKFSKKLLDDKLQFYKNILELASDWIHPGTARLLKRKLLYFERKTPGRALRYFSLNPMGLINRFYADARRQFPPGKAGVPEEQVIRRWVDGLVDPGPEKSGILPGAEGLSGTRDGAVLDKGNS